MAHLSARVLNPAPQILFVCGEYLDIPVISGSFILTVIVSNNINLE